MKKLLFIFCISIIFLFFSSCYSYPCITGELRFGLIGFSDADADTMIIRRFEKKSIQQKDSFFINDNVYKRYADTLKIVASTSAVVLSPEYDYHIYFPGPDILLNISNITEEKVSVRKFIGGTKEGCINRITGYTINDVRVNIFSGYDRIYFRK